MKKIVAIFILFFTISPRVNAQLLDSLALEQAYEYRSLEEAMQEPEKVIKLNLKRSKLKTFPQEIYQFPNLQVLILRNNKIEEIPEDVGRLEMLQILDFSKNSITSVPATIGDLSNLKKLKLSENDISEIPTEISKLEKLEYLILWGTEITELPVMISALSGTLKFLDMRVIYMNQDKQNAIMDLLPYTYIRFSSSCNCN